MRVSVDRLGEGAGAAGVKAPAVCVFVHPTGDGGGAADGLGLTGSDMVDRAVSEELAGRRKGSDGRARLGRAAVIDAMGLVPARRIILAWLGGRENILGGAGVGLRPSGVDRVVDAVRHAAGAAAVAARDAGCPSLAVVVPQIGPWGERTGEDGPVAAVRQIVEGAKLSMYAFDRYKAKGARAGPRSLAILVGGPAGPPVLPGARRAARRAEAAADGAILARDLANLPPNECPPAALARAARSLCSASPALRCRVVSGAALQKGGFGGLLAVGGGSASAPCLIVVEYRGSGGTASARLQGHAGGDRPLQFPAAIVGKAVTFDTGGISLKPREKMDEMKFDKCGGCAVLGIMSAAARMRLSADVVGIIPAAENMPGASSYRPGDIVRLYGGRTAEIVNTDAEGRLILADAIAYAESEYRPCEIIDLATLTGACVVALGANTAGLFSNDDGLAGRLLAASARTAEDVWRLPLGADHVEAVRSRVADVKNMGTGRAAGAAAAAAFLYGAVKATPWAHLDIAGTAWTQTGTAKRPYNPHGATGFGVRLLLDHLAAPRGRAAAAAAAAPDP